MEAPHRDQVDAGVQDPLEEQQIVRVAVEADWPTDGDEDVDVARCAYPISGVSQGASVAGRAALSHPIVLASFDVGSHDGVPCQGGGVGGGGDRSPGGSALAAGHRDGEPLGRGLLPVLQAQARDARELCDVVGDQREVVGDRGRRDHEVVGADGSPGPLQLGPDDPVPVSAGVVEG